MSDLTTTINRYVGRPWNANGFDCWQFVRAVYDDAFGILLPHLPGVDGGDVIAAARAAADLRESGDWLPVTTPRDGDAVVMSRRTHPHHVGIIIGGRIAHCDQIAGVVCQTPLTLRALGWGTLTYFRHRTHA